MAIAGLLNEPLKSMYQPLQNILQCVAESGIMELRELIKQYPELGDTFAEFENRISFLENSLPYHQEVKPEIKTIFRPRPVDKEIDQLKAGYIHLQNKLNEHLDKSKTTKGKDIL